MRDICCKKSRSEGHTVKSKAKRGMDSNIGGWASKYGHSEGESETNASMLVGTKRFKDTTASNSRGSTRYLESDVHTKYPAGWLGPWRRKIKKSCTGRFAPPGRKSALSTSAVAEGTCSLRAPSRPSRTISRSRGDRPAYGGKRCTGMVEYWISPFDEYSSTKRERIEGSAFLRYGMRVYVEGFEHTQTHCTDVTFLNAMALGENPPSRSSFLVRRTASVTFAHGRSHRFVPP